MSMCYLGDNLFCRYNKVASSTLKQLLIIFVNLTNHKYCGLLKSIPFICTMHFSSTNSVLCNFAHTVRNALAILTYLFLRMNLFCDITAFMI